MPILSTYSVLGLYEYFTAQPINHISMMRVKVVGPLGALCEALYTSVANSRSWGFAADLIEGFCFASESKHSANNESPVAVDNLSHRPTHAWSIWVELAI